MKIKYSLIVLFTFLICYTGTALAASINFIKQLDVGGQKIINVSLADLLENNFEQSSYSQIFEQNKVVKIKNESKITISREEIVRSLKKLKREYPETKELNFRVPSRVIIHHRGLGLKSEVVARALRKQWEQQCSSCQFVIENLTLPQLTEEHQEEEWHLQKSMNLPKGRFSVQVIFPRLKSHSSLWVTGQAQVRKPVLVLKKNITKGKMIQKSDVQVRFRSREQVRGGILDFNLVTGKLANRHLVSGEVLKESYLMSKIFFRRGDAVRLVFQNKSFRVVASGIAESTGKAGKSVWVKNLTSKKRVSGRVSPDGEVIIK